MALPTIDQQITFLYTRDLARSAAFYEDILGLPLVLDQGGCRIYRVAGEAFLGICQRDTAPVDPGDPGTRQVIVTLVTEDVDAFCAGLEARGAVLHQQPALNRRYGIHHAFLRDPNGYLIEIQRFIDPRWPRHGAGPDRPTGPTDAARR